MNDAGGLFNALFDFNFDRFVTPSVVKILYIIGMALLGLAYLSGVVAGFLSGVVQGVLALVVGAIVALFYLIWMRVGLEFFYAVIRMSEDIHHRR